MSVVALLTRGKVTTRDPHLQFQTFGFTLIPSSGGRVENNSCYVPIYTWPTRRTVAYLHGGDVTCGVVEFDCIIET